MGLGWVQYEVHETQTAYADCKNFQVHITTFPLVSAVMFMLATGILTTGYSKFMYFARDDGKCSLTHQPGGPCD